MAYIPLTGEETCVIFGGETVDNLESLDATDQRTIIERLATIAESEAAPDRFVYEHIGNIDIIRAGGPIRLYTKVVPNIPRGDTEYHVIYVFFIDSKHDYDQADLATYSPDAQAELDRITALETVDDVEAYLEEHDALGPTDLRALL